MGLLDGQGGMRRGGKQPLELGSGNGEELMTTNEF